MDFSIAYEFKITMEPTGEFSGFVSGAGRDYGSTTSVDKDAFVPLCESLQNSVIFIRGQLHRLEKISKFLTSISDMTVLQDQM